MKYIKKFEESINSDLQDYDKTKFWLVTTESPYFKAALKKIGLTYMDINAWIEDKSILSNKFIYVIKPAYSSDRGYNWSNTNITISSDCIFNGPCEIPPHLLEEYNMLISAEKYNL